MQNINRRQKEDNSLTKYFVSERNDRKTKPKTQLSHLHYNNQINTININKENRTRQNSNSRPRSIFFKVKNKKLEYGVEANQVGLRENGSQDGNNVCL